MHTLHWLHLGPWSHTGTCWSRFPGEEEMSHLSPLPHHQLEEVQMSYKRTETTSWDHRSSTLMSFVNRSLNTVTQRTNYTQLCELVQQPHWVIAWTTYLLLVIAYLSFILHYTLCLIKFQIQLFPLIHKMPVWACGYLTAKDNITEDPAISSIQHDYLCTLYGTWE